MATLLQRKVKAFYRDLWHWIKIGMPDDPVFSKNRSVCCQVRAWITGMHEYIPGYDVEVYEVEIAISDEFEKAGLNATFPFNGLDDGLSAYKSWTKESNTGTVYDNAARVAWIKKRAR